jgi:hypothetical protein
MVVKIMFCNPAPTCTDSDGGIDYYVKGTVVDKYKNVHVDECGTDGKGLFEVSCDITNAGLAHVDYSTCAYGCVDGACLKEPSPTPTPLPTESTDWTQWFDRDDPSGSGDYELLSNIRSAYPDVCENPAGVECRATLTKADSSKTGEVVTCSKESGFSCVNANQPDGICRDYEVRFYCGTLDAISSCEGDYCLIYEGSPAIWNGREVKISYISDYQVKLSIGNLTTNLLHELEVRTYEDVKIKIPAGGINYSTYEGFINSVTVVIEEVTISCTNECSYSGQKICDGNYLKTCGNYDADSCLE